MKGPPTSRRFQVPGVDVTVYVRGRGEKSPLGHGVRRTEEPVGEECPLGLRPSLCKPPWGASGFGAPEMAAPAPSAWQARSITKNLQTVCRKALAVLEISGAVCWGLSGRLHDVTRAEGSEGSPEPCTPRDWVP